MNEKTFDRLLWTALVLAMLVALWLAPRTSAVPSTVDPVVEALELAADAPLEVLKLQLTDAPADRLLGADAQNRIHDVGSTAELVSALRRAVRYDVVAVLADRASRDPQLETLLADGGYTVVVEDAESLIALPKERVRITPLLDDDALDWAPFAAPEGARLEGAPHHPGVASTAPADAGFMTQPLALEGKLLVEVRLHGALTGGDPHAAHFSVHARQPLLVFGAGTLLPSQPFRTVVEFGVHPGEERRLAFGLGGWAKGAGDVHLDRVTISRLEILKGAATASAPRPAVADAFAPPAIFALTVAVLLACGYLGRAFLRASGVSKPALLGSGMLLGLCVLAAALILSLRYLQTMTIGGALVGVLFAAATVRGVVARYRKPSDPEGRPASGVARRGPEDVGTRVTTLDVLTHLTIASWVGYIATIFFPLQLMATAPQYPFPEVFDLPKQLFAVRSIFDAAGWPPPSPFFRGETFAYNFGFYMPAAFVAKIVGNRVATLQTFAVTCLAVAVVLPVLILEVSRALIRSKAIRFACVLLATWVGGLTPLWLDNHALGANLPTRGLIQSLVYAEETFIYLLYVPQHVFAALCALLSVVLMAGTSKDPDRDVGRLACAAVVTFAGSVASMLILPYLVVAYALGGLVVVGRRVAGASRVPKSGPRIAVALAVLVAPLILLAPFVLEAKSWSGGETGLVSRPVLSWQWFYIVSSFGLVVGLAVWAVPALVRRPSIPTDRRLAFGIGGLALLGIGGMLTGGGHADAGIKAALLVRIALVPLAGLGLVHLLGRPSRDKWFASQTLAALFAAFLVVNLPSAQAVLKRALIRIDPAGGVFIDYVRKLPQDARILMFDTDQAVPARIARQIDFDFSAARAGSYLPPERRQNVEAFWAGVKQRTPGSIEALKARCDYAIAPLDSDAYRLMGPLFGRPVVIGKLAIFRTHPTIAAK